MDVDPKIARLSEIFGAAIRDVNPSFEEMSQVTGRLVVGIFLKTVFTNDDRMERFDNFVAVVREALIEEIEAGNAYIEER